MSGSGPTPLTIYHHPKAQAPALVLVHGWGFGSAVWQPLVATLQQQFSLYLLDLPGYGANSNATADDWHLLSLLEYIERQLPFPAIWVGWSLGGQLAAEYAMHQPDRVTGLLTLCSNPCFVANSAWQNAMASSTFSEFARATDENPHASLNRFAGLVAQGSPQQRQDLRFLQSCLKASPMPEADLLSAGLKLLSSLDSRAAYTELTLPHAHLLGALDALVPTEAADAITNLNPRAQVILLEQACHIPWLQQLGEVLLAITALAHRVSQHG